MAHLIGFIDFKSLRYFNTRYETYLSEHFNQLKFNSGKWKRVSFELLLE